MHDRKLDSVPESLAPPSTHEEECMVAQLQSIVKLYIDNPAFLEYQAIRNNHFLNNAKFYQPSKRPKGYRKRKAKSCWGNSQTLAMEQPDLTYVEGFAFSVTTGPAFEHAWCITADETVIDVTWTQPGIVYYGIAVEHEVLLKHLRKTALATGDLRPIFEPDFFDPSVEWAGGRIYRQKSD